MSEAASLPPARLDHFQVLDAAGCEDWVLRVSLLRRHWRRRHPRAPFFTLGMAAYLDAGMAGGAYHDRVQRRANNMLLRQHFSPLLEQVADALRRYWPQPLAFADEEAALPGFHVYLSDPVFARPVASVHRDLQHRDVFADATDGDALFSFTLPLSAPPGSGLKLWDSTVDQTGAQRFVPYRDGELVLHNGLAIHQAILACSGTVERITLQGHALRRGPQILLYW